MYNLRGQMNHLANHSRDHLPSTQGKMSHLVVFWQVCMKIGRPKSPKISWLRNNNLLAQNLQYYFFFPQFLDKLIARGLSWANHRLPQPGGHPQYMPCLMISISLKKHLENHCLNHAKHGLLEIIVFFLHFLWRTYNHYERGL